jgi:hypothetical protein
MTRWNPAPPTSPPTAAHPLKAAPPALVDPLLPAGNPDPPLPPLDPVPRAPSQRTSVAALQAVLPAAAGKLLVAALVVNALHSLLLLRGLRGITLSGPCPSLAGALSRTRLGCSWASSAISGPAGHDGLSSALSTDGLLHAWLASLGHERPIHRAQLRRHQYSTSKLVRLVS